MEKIKFIAPIAVVATIFATSCNKGWPTLSEADAITRAAKVAEIQKDFKDLNTTICEETETDSGKLNGAYAELSINTKIEINVEKKYYKETIKTKENSSAISIDATVINYIVEKDGIFYELNNIGGIKTKKESSSTHFENAVNEYVEVESFKYIYTDSCESSLRVILTDLNSTITNFKNHDEKYKKDSTDYYCNCTFISDSETNFGVKENAKYKWDDEGVATVRTVTGEYKLENGYNTYNNQKIEDKVDDNNYTVTVKTKNQQISPTVTVDNINIDEYKDIK